MILAVAVGFTNYLIDAQVPKALVDWTRENIHSPMMFLLILNLVLLVVGCLMDIFTAIIVVVPLIVPIAQNFGINGVHLGIIFVANLELGYLTPPVGLNLFLSSYRFKKPVLEIARASFPMLRDPGRRRAVHHVRALADAGTAAVAGTIVRNSSSL